MPETVQPAILESLLLVCGREAGLQWFDRICPAECVLRPLIAWLGSILSFGSSPEVNDGRSNGAECGEGAVLA